MKKQKKLHKPTKRSEENGKKFPYLSVFGFAIGIGGILLAVLFTKVSDTGFAPNREFIGLKSMNITCSDDYRKLPVFPGCTPTHVCGRCVKDGLVNAEEVNTLLSLAKRALKYGGSNGGASILDLHSGALSKGDKFVNIYNYLDKDQLSAVFPQDDMKLFYAIKDRIHETIADQFGIDASKLYFTKPTFFSRMTSSPAQTQHDEYWHSHIDKIQYGSFDYTSLLYLNDYNKDFNGGRFFFDDPPNDVTIEPRSGRISFFTSGSENPHHVEKVTNGTRYALTVSFTCDPKHAIKDMRLS